MNHRRLYTRIVIVSFVCELKEFLQSSGEQLRRKPKRDNLLPQGPSSIFGRQCRRPSHKSQFTPGTRLYTKTLQQVRKFLAFPIISPIHHPMFLFFSNIKERITKSSKHYNNKKKKGLSSPPPMFHPPFT